MEDIMFGPCFDQAGKLRGVVQLFHKIGKNRVKETDIAEFSRVLPIVGAMISHFDELKLAKELNSTVKLRLDTSTK